MAEAARAHDEGTPDDALYAKARAAVILADRASTSWLQRQLRLGYNTAVGLLERMEREGLVSAPDQVGRRTVLPDAIGDTEMLAANLAAFEAEREAGHFALWWNVHGLFYGIPRDIEADLAARRVVVANLSRGVLAEAATRYPLRVLVVTAPVAVLAARLTARGRESAADSEARLQREMTLAPGLDIATGMNDATPEEGAARVVAELTRAAEDARRS